MGNLRENHEDVERRIREACVRAGRDRDDVRLIWVSKNHPRERLIEATSLGARIFGENRVQEALEKFPLPPPRGNPQDSPSPELHFIGRMQKNKIRKVLPLATAFHSVDSLELLEAVDRIAGELSVRRDVFLQVNTSREPAKGGFEPEALPGVLAELPPLPNVRLVGLMTMGPLETPAGGPAGPEEARRCFRELAAMLGSIREKASLGGRGAAGPLKDMAWLSMGMTGDFEVAIEEGAHFIRVGTGLFGAREIPGRETPGPGPGPG
ncbi:MAG: alanine racemase domain protein [Fibrobacteres bacterium]|nr:alanine racemase domain protein [Fibrobacterota bacterium]